MWAIDWPDLIIGAIIVIATLHAARRGFILELSGPVALMAALIVPWYYGGAFDDVIARTVHIGGGSAHVVGMFLTAIVAFAIIMAAAYLLNRFAKLPGFNLVNAALGAFIGLLKGVLFVFAVLFVALYFPLSIDIRHDLSQSVLAHWITAPNAALDRMFHDFTPSFLQSVVDPILERHHV